MCYSCLSNAPTDHSIELVLYLITMDIGLLTLEPRYFANTAGSYRPAMAMV